MILLLLTKSVKKDLSIQCQILALLVGLFKLFLQQSHVFSTISKILSRGEGDVETAGDHTSPKVGHIEGGVEQWADLTSQVEVNVSSRQAMIPSLTDGSTETFWESGDEDRNKTKWISVKLNVSQARSIAVHVDNGRDIGNKVR